jgi:hypothetical protein
MKIVGCDLHPHHQQIAVLDDETELLDRRLGHAGGEAKEFYTRGGGPSFSKRSRLCRHTRVCPTFVVFRRLGISGACAMFIVTERTPPALAKRDECDMLLKILHTAKYDFMIARAVQS